MLFVFTYFQYIVLIEKFKGLLRVLTKQIFLTSAKTLVLPVIFIYRLTSRFELCLQQTYVLMRDAICDVRLHESVYIILNEPQF